MRDGPDSRREYESDAESLGRSGKPNGFTPDRSVFQSAPKSKSTAKKVPIPNCPIDYTVVSAGRNGASFHPLDPNVVINGHQREEFEVEEEELRGIKALSSPSRLALCRGAKKAFGFGGGNHSRASQYVPVETSSPKRSNGKQEKLKGEEHSRIAACTSALLAAPTDTTSQPSCSRVPNGSNSSQSSPDSAKSHRKLTRVSPKQFQFQPIAIDTGMDPSVIADPNRLQSGSEVTAVQIHSDSVSSVLPITVNNNNSLAEDRNFSRSPNCHHSPVATRISPNPGDPQELHNSKFKICTSFRLKLTGLKNPVDACLLPDGFVAIADYDNGFVLVNQLGETVEHLCGEQEKNACGVAFCPEGLKLLVLVYKDGCWAVNVYRNFRTLTESLKCPTDPQLEGWALRKLVVTPDSVLHLMGSGELKCCIWRYSWTSGTWTAVLAETSKKGGYNDMSVSEAKDGESLILLCDMKKSQLSTLNVNDKGEVVDQKTIRVRRNKGQEWVVQGPNLAILDEETDIIVYDSSGKLFFFDGDTYKCKKIIGDIGRGEVSSVFVRKGWAYVLCRYRLCIEAFLYKEDLETSL